MRSFSVASAWCLRAPRRWATSSSTRRSSQRCGRSTGKRELLVLCPWCLMLGPFLVRGPSPTRTSDLGPRTDQGPRTTDRSEEHTSELQSQSNLVCRLLLEKKNKLISQILHVQL